MASSGISTTQQGRTGRKKAAAVPETTEKSAEVSDMDKLDLIILKEIKAYNLYSVSTHNSKKIWETIVERSNGLITVHKLKVGSRNERNIKDRLKKLIRERTAKVNKEINTTGGGATDPLSEAEHLIVGIINDQNKSEERFQAEEEKEEAEADEVKSIQQKALLIMKRKRTDDEDIFEGVEDWKADEEREFLLDVGINRDNRQAEEEDGADASNKDEGNTDGKNDGKADGAHKKKTTAQIEPGKKRLRVNATERMMDNKMKVDQEIKDAELRTKLVIAKMEIAEREKDREIRRKEQEMQENKIKLEHEFNMRKLELETQLELEKQRKSSLENNTVSALLQ
ncbi:hypothetical protein RvY_19112-2, partial [Ramazzottius varieornatus]